MKITSKVVKKNIMGNPKISLVLKYIPQEILPLADYLQIEIILDDTCSSFANGIRRTLLELETLALDIDDSDVKTDDKFILNDVIRGNLNLIPINQDVEYTEEMLKKMKLSVYNQSNKLIRVMAWDIENVDIKKLIPYNIEICKLHSGKFITINNFNIVSGSSKTTAKKFTAFDNVSYDILNNFKDYTMFDVKDHGRRSTTYSPKKFSIKIKTAGNIKSNTIFDRLYDHLSTSFNTIKNSLELYRDGKNDDKDLTVEEKDNGLFIFTFMDKYIVESNILAQYVYKLDENISYINGTIGRYDDKIDKAVIKIKHVEKTKILIDACDLYLKDLNIFINHMKSKK